MASPSIQRALQQLSLPEWVGEVSVHPMIDAEGQPSVTVRIVIKHGRDEVLRDGKALTEVQSKVHDAVRASGTDLWPYVRFISAEEAA